jgi:hypothetical protein
MQHVKQHFNMNHRNANIFIQYSKKFVSEGGKLVNPQNLSGMLYGRRAK